MVPSGPPLVENGFTSTVAPPKDRYDNTDFTPLTSGAFIRMWFGLGVDSARWRIYMRTPCTERRAMIPTSWMDRYFWNATKYILC